MEEFWSKKNPYTSYKDPW